MPEDTYEVGSGETEESKKYWRERLHGARVNHSPAAMRAKANGPWPEQVAHEFRTGLFDALAKREDDIEIEAYLSLQDEYPVKHMGYVPGPSDGKPGNEAEVFAKQVADLVNSPSHYTQGPTESIDVIRQALGAAGFKGFCVGNAIKYVHRARFKGTEDTDLKKAIWYLRMATDDDPRKERA